MDTKKKLGLWVFFLGVLYMVGVGWFLGWWSATTYRTLSLAQISNTVWSSDQPLFWLWAFSIPLGAVFVGVGLLLYDNAKTSRVWIFGCGVLLINVLIQLIPQKPHLPPVFGIFGGIILTLFLLTLWFWAKKRAAVEKKAKMTADLQLVGYVFLVIAMWFLCGSLGRQFFPSFSAIEPGSPVHIIIYLALGWLFLFLGQYKEVKLLRN
jgi:hypothetical protein